MSGPEASGDQTRRGPAGEDPAAEPLGRGDTAARHSGPGGLAATPATPGASDLRELGGVIVDALRREREKTDRLRALLDLSRRDVDRLANDLAGDYVRENERLREAIVAARRELCARESPTHEDLDAAFAILTAALDGEDLDA